MSGRGGQVYVESFTRRRRMWYGPAARSFCVLATSRSAMRCHGAPSYSKMERGWKRASERTQSSPSLSARETWDAIEVGGSEAGWTVSEMATTSLTSASEWMLETSRCSAGCDVASVASVASSSTRVASAAGTPTGGGSSTTNSSVTVFVSSVTFVVVSVIRRFKLSFVCKRGIFQ